MLTSTKPKGPVPIITAAAISLSSPSCRKLGHSAQTQNPTPYTLAQADADASSTKGAGLWSLLCSNGIGYLRLPSPPASDKAAAVFSSECRSLLPAQIRMSLGTEMRSRRYLQARDVSVPSDDEGTVSGARFAAPISSCSISVRAIRNACMCFDTEDRKQKIENGPTE